jgi:LuxR family maltose regulon positive regulatory protein
MADLEAARSALSAHEWAKARSLLLGVVNTSESAEALEMLGIAAWWLDDGETAVSARERLFGLRRNAGDTAGAARVAIQLAWDATIFRSDAAVARGWAARGRSLLDGQAPGSDHVWLALREATLDASPPAAFASARQLAREHGSIDAEMAAACLEGRALAADGRIEEGLRLMDEAIAAACADEIEDPLAITFACCQILGVCGRVRDFDRATQWCERIEVLCDRLNIWSVLSVARCFYAPILIARGKLAQAERILIAAEIGYNNAISHHAREARAWLAEIRVRQGRVEEARRLLESAEPEPLCRLTRAALALADGNVDEAAEHATTFLRQADGAWHVERATALELVGRAEARRGNTAEAEAALASLEHLEATVRTSPLRGSTLVVRAALAESRGDYPTARAALADAADVLERGHTPYEAACARIELARVLGLSGRPKEAERERIRGENALRDLRAVAVPGPLTAREIEVLQLAAQGMSNAEIGARLVLSPHTVHRHLANIMRKLDASSRIEAAARARDLLLI